MALSRNEELELLLLLERSNKLWEPQPGPQLMAYDSDADELLYGGAAGGGKTDLILGLAHTQHDKTIIFRREFPQLKGIEDRGEEIFPPLGAKYNGGKSFWKFKNGRQIELGAVQREDDVKKYQGRPHDLICVERGTRVKMGDGSLKAVEDVQVGDMVLTLEGPYPVTRLIPLRRDLGVRVSVLGPGGVVVAAQTQSRTHEVLTPSGWASYDTCGPHHGGEPPLVYLHRDSGQAGVQPCRLPPSDAGLLSPRDSEDSALAGTPTHSLHKGTYRHPYTREIRSVVGGLGAYSVTYEPTEVIDLFDLEVAVVNNYISEGGFVNRNCFDEAAHFLESQIRFLTGWNRSSKPGQRCRVVLASNPPTSAEGLWMMRRYAPWLDPRHRNPAKPGELRWFITNEKGEDEEVSSNEPLVREIKRGDELKEMTFRPKSRTFIPAKLADNAYLRDTDYWATLQALPEPLRSQMLHGDFTAGGDDDRWQTIPTEWVKAAQNRWRRMSKPDIHIDRVGVDVARGGRDQTIFTENRGGWFQQKTIPGSKTPDGMSVVQELINAGYQGCKLQVDIIGVGSAVIDVAKMHGMACTGLNAAEKSEATDRTGRLKFINKRAEYWWSLREALDPETGSKIALPDDPELLADLTAPRWSLTVRGVQIESKDDVRERLGRSPDKADSLTYAHYIGGVARDLAIWERLAR